MQIVSPKEDGEEHPNHLLLEKDLQASRSNLTGRYVDCLDHLFPALHGLQVGILEAGLGRYGDVLTALAAQFVKLQSPNR